MVQLVHVHACKHASACAESSVLAPALWECCLVESLPSSYFLDLHTESLLRVQVWPYWAYTYAPDPFQPALSDEQWQQGITVARCPGFDNDTAHYTCLPPPNEWANCWKCPPKVGASCTPALLMVVSGPDTQVQVPLHARVWSRCWAANHPAHLLLGT